jgi:hypothetical protein
MGGGVAFRIFNVWCEAASLVVLEAADLIVRDSRLIICNGDEIIFKGTSRPECGGKLEGNGSSAAKADV